jgi:adenylate kinase
MKSGREAVTNYIHVLPYSPEQGKEIEQIMKNGELVPAETTVALLKKAIKSNRTAKGFLVDGFPRKIDQAELFEREVS